MTTRRLLVAPDLWVEFLKLEMPITLRATNPLPADARCVGTDYDHDQDAVVLLIRSDHFRPGDPVVIESPRIELVSP